MLHRKYVVFTLVLAFLALSGCANSSRERLRSVSEQSDAVYFYVGDFSSLHISSVKSMGIDGRAWNWAEFLASVCHDSIKERNIYVGKITASVGGYNADEIKLAGRRHELILSWQKSGKLSLFLMLYEENGKTAYASKEDVRKYAVVDRKFSTSKIHHEDDEAFYEGLKTELRPVIDSLFDEAFDNIRKAGVTDI